MYWVKKYTVFCTSFETWKDIVHTTDSFSIPMYQSTWHWHTLWNHKQPSDAISSHIISKGGLSRPAFMLVMAHVWLSTASPRQEGPCNYCMFLTNLHLEWPCLQSYRQNAHMHIHGEVRDINWEAAVAAVTHFLLPIYLISVTQAHQLVLYISRLHI